MFFSNIYKIYTLKKDNFHKILQVGKHTIAVETEALSHLQNALDDSFVQAVTKILTSKGRLIITGVGKSANVATKIVATMNSTGTPAVFMHASDAVHGDLGIIQQDDIVLIISKSGNTPEIKVLIPLIKNFGNIIIGLTADKDSYLGQKSDILLYTPLEKEACPNNLAPTTSTTLQMVMGDALAVALLQTKGFNEKDFAKYHPGGSLGKKLYLRVKDVLDNQNIPQSSPDDSIVDVIVEISRKRLGATAIIDNNIILGIITDGDIRRMLQKNININELKAKDIMSSSPKTISHNALAVEALKKMKENNINQLLVVDEKGYYNGMIHLHDLLKEGLL